MLYAYNHGSRFLGALLHTDTLRYQYGVVETPAQRGISKQFESVGALGGAELCNCTRRSLWLFHSGLNRLRWSKIGAFFDPEELVLAARSAADTHRVKSDGRSLRPTASPSQISTWGHHTGPGGLRQCKIHSRGCAYGGVNGAQSSHFWRFSRAYGETFRHY